MNFKKYIALIAAVSLTAAMFTACGKKETASSQGTNIVPNAENGGVEVQLDERTDGTKYQYDTDDLSFIDTKSGEKIAVGMTIEDIETITGEPTRKDGSSRVYNGISVQYDENNTAVSIIISGGEFKDEAVRYRFKTSRGVGLDTTFEDFTKAYGDLSNERQEGETAEADGIPANAVRYFMADGNKVEYLGNEKNDQVNGTEENKLYMQYFMFDKETNCVSAIRVTRADHIGK